MGHAVYVSRLPFFEGPVIDAHVYRAFARHVAATSDLGGPFYQPPLYPLFLALLEKLGLGAAWAVAVVQAVLGSATAALLVLVGRELASAERARCVGLGTGLAGAFYGPLVLFDLEFLPPSVVLFVFVAAAVLLLRRGRSRWTDGLAGTLLGLAATGWPMVAIAGVAFVGLRARRAGCAREAIVASALVAAASAPPVLLAAAHNAAAGAPGIVVSYNSGINLWLGNNPSWRDTWRARPGAAFEPEFERPDREGKVTPLARDGYYSRAVIRDALARPGAFVRRTAEKAYYVWHGREIRRNQDIETLRRASPVLRVLLWERGIFFPFGVVAPLALAAALRRRTEPEIRVMASAAAAYTFALAVYFVAARYRLPLIVLALPLAVDEAIHLAGARPRVPELAALAALFVAINLPNAFTRSFEATETERALLLAQSWRNQGDPARAAAIGRALAASDPADANVHLLHAESLIADRRCAEAVTSLGRVTELAPRASTPWVLLGSCHAELGRWGDAERAFATALSLHPFHPVALKRMGLLYARHGRLAEARALLVRFEQAGYRDEEVAAFLR